jgi:hypothetical protein
MRHYYTTCTQDKEQAMIKFKYAVLLLILIVSAGAAPVTTGATGDMYITTTIDSATVEIDGQPVTGQTPLLLEKIAAGKHRIIVYKDEFSGTLDVDLRPNDILKVMVGIQKGFAGLKIYSTPADARVFVDNMERGSTPLKIDDLKAGPHTVRVVKPGHTPVVQDIQAISDSILRLDFTLMGLARLHLTVKPMNAAITINGQRPGTILAGGLEVPAGRVAVVVAADNYESYTDTLVLEAGEERNLMVYLRFKFGTLRVESNPPGASVVVNDTWVGTTLYVNAEALPGLYRLRVKKPTYQEVVRDVTMERGKTQNVLFNLEHSQAYWDSLRADHERDMLRLKLVVRYAMGALAAISSGTAIYMDMQASSKLKEQNDIHWNYQNAGYGADFDKYRRDYTAAGEAADQYIKKRNTWGWVAGVSGALCGVTFIF